MPTTWTNTTTVTTTWTNDSDYIPQSALHKTYDQAGLTYDLAGNYYDWGIPRTPQNEDNLWDNSASIATVWS